MHNNELDAKVEVVGPFGGHSKLTVGGYHVPYITIYPNLDDSVDLVVDNRFCATFTQEELDKFGWILAQAMAVAAGYTSHGVNCQRSNPFKTRMMGITTTLSDIPEDGGKDANE